MRDGEYMRLVTGKRNCALLTGANGGLGREIARALGERDYFLVLSGRNNAAVRTVLGEDRAGTVVTGDISDIDTADMLADMADLYNTNLIVYAAGVYSSGGIDAETVTSVNYTGAVRLLSKTYPVLKRTGGMFVYINSVAGKNISPPNEAAYAGSKHAMSGFLKSFRLQARQDGVRILDVYIGGMNTLMTMHRADQKYLIDPKEAADVIVRAALDTPLSLQIEELSIGRFAFPPK